MQIVAVAGAGLIGRAWAITFARAGCHVRLWDPDVKMQQHELEVEHSDVDDRFFHYGLVFHIFDTPREVHQG